MGKSALCRQVIRDRTGTSGMSRSRLVTRSESSNGDTARVVARGGRPQPTHFDILAREAHRMPEMLEGSLSDEPWARVTSRVSSTGRETLSRASPQVRRRD